VQDALHQVVLRKALRGKRSQASQQADHGSAAQQETAWRSTSWCGMALHASERHNRGRYTLTGMATGSQSPSTPPWTLHQSRLHKPAGPFPHLAPPPPNYPYPPELGRPPPQPSPGTLTAGPSSPCCP
jgi:hypothetical protein